MNTPTRTAPGRRLTGDAAFRQAPEPHPTLLPVRFLMRLSGQPGCEPMRMPDPGQGERESFTVDRGDFEGPGLKGTVVAHSGGWAIASARGSLRLDVRLALRTHDGAELLVFYRGFLVDREYARVTGQVEVGDTRYSWLEDTVFFGVGRITADGSLTHRLYAVE